MANLFISYASPDRIFALRLADHLEVLGHAVWIDRRQLPVGASLFEYVGSGLEQSDVLILILSRHAATSVWMASEWQAKSHEELTTGRECILPVLLEDCAVPYLLRAKRYADFRQSYAIGFAQLAITLHGYRASSVPAVTTVPQTNSLHSTIEGDWYTQAMIKTPPRPSEVSVELAIPYLGKITGKWQPDAHEQAAAWELYVEFVTRVSVSGLEEDEGLLRESLSSLYMLFTLTRDIIRKYGPSIARPQGDSQLSLGLLTIHVLNYVLRPILARWHPLLHDYEQRKDPTVSQYAHERAWERSGELRHELQGCRPVLNEYTQLLARVADIPQTMAG